MRLDRLGTIKGLAKACDTCVGFDMNPENIGKFFDAKGSQCGDLHGSNMSVAVPVLMDAALPNGLDGGEE